MKARQPVPRGGFAMLVVLLVLMALLVLCTPFLMTVRNADQASAQGADRVSLELALDAAGRVASARLGASHSALDPTPDHDSLAELGVGNELGGPAFLDANDPRGVMFDLAVHDVSGRIDLNSAPPQVIGNLMGAVGVTVETVPADAEEIRLTSTAGFLDAGFVWIEGELIGYAQRDGNALTGLVRALAAGLDADGKPLPCGPQPARSYPSNTVVIDQRAWAFARWRGRVVDGDVQRMDAIERLADVVPLMMAGELGDDAYDALVRAGTVYAGVGGGREWQHAARVRNQLVAGIDCKLQLEDPRWFNEGTTVRITDGETVELGVVRGAGGSTITLMDPVASDYATFSAVVEPLARRPVNVNTATPAVLEALLLNLQLRGRQSRITPREVDDLIEVIVASRPFTSFEDFARRVIFPAAGWELLPADAPVVPERLRAEEGLEAAEAAAGMAFLDEDDARALYKNALNANDAELAFSTLPFAFTSTDVHHMELRAAVNAPSGVERARGVREQVENVVPQRDLMFVATRQEDFEQLFRLDRDAAGWATGPWATSRYDAYYGSSPPTRSRAHLGTRDTMPPEDAAAGEVEYVFAERDPTLDDGFAMPWAMREEEVGRRVGRMLHFDAEARELEGRYLPDGTEVSAVSDAHVQWLDGQGLMRPFAFSMWIKPAELEEGALFLDVGGTYSDADRASLLIEGGDLVLRVLDGAGDHPETAFEEVAEARYPLASAEGPGMPLDTWIHVAVDVRGTRPDQMMLLVDGRWHAEQPGLTRLTSSLGPDSATISVESTDGFPAHCVLRIGEELVEAVVSGPTSFDAQFASQGENAGFGGRLARIEFVGVEGFEVPDASGLQVATSHPTGTTVELYGYSLQIQGNVPQDQAQLTSDVGAFAVGRVTGVNGDVAGGLQEVTAIFLDGSAIQLGRGFEDHPQVTLQLAPVDGNMAVEQMMSAFQRNGGYAVLASAAMDYEIGKIGVGQTDGILTAKGNPIGGVEVVHYSGWEGNELTIDKRGSSLVGELPDLASASGYTSLHAWIVEFEVAYTDGVNVWDPNDLLQSQVKIFPISLGVGNAGALADGPNTSENPRFAQITRLGGDSGLTEWVRYDYNDGQQLVRDDPDALERAYNAVQGGAVDGTLRGTLGGGPGGGGQPGGGGPGGGGGTGGAPAPLGLVVDPPAPTPPPLVAPPAPTTPVDGALWHYRIGEREHAVGDYPISLSVNSVLEFRGVLGTFDHPHPQGAAVLPVWRTADDVNADRGRMGRFDAVTLIDTQPIDPGFPGVVQHAHRPNSRTLYTWQDEPPILLSAGPPALELDADEVEWGDPDPFDPKWTYVALQGPVQVPIAGGTIFQPAAGQTSLYDARLYTRANKFPSGELPRLVTTVAVGGAFTSGAGVPAATIDEVVFGNTDVGGVVDLAPGQPVLASALTEAGDVFGVWPLHLRVALGRFSLPSAVLATWPQDGGLVRIGDEVLCYASYDAPSGVLTVAQNGRGMLGTDPQPHDAGEPIALLQHLPVSVLTSGVGADDAFLSLVNLEEFPRQGLVWIEDELVHYTWQDGTGLGMPRGSAEPGAMDRDGPGLFRGRFGTTPNAHGAGTPVVLHPFRYWDRWAEKADAPELHYLGASLAQPAAFWRTTFFDVEEPGVSGPRLGVLVRTDPSVPWDADPQETDGLDVLYDGLREGAGVPVGAQADRLEWRVFVRWDQDSYDPAGGMLHGWKASPRLRYLGAEYLAPPRILRRVAR